MTTMETRPWTIGGRPKRRPTKLKTPQINTYFKQIQKCQELYSKLKLDSSSTKLITAPFPKIQVRDKTFLSLPAQRRSNDFLTPKLDVQSVQTDSSDDFNRRDTDRRHCARMTPKRLCEYLRSKGLGQPRVVTSSYMKRPNETVVNPNPQPFFKILPKNNTKNNRFKTTTKLHEESPKVTKTLEKDDVVKTENKLTIPEGETSLSWLPAPLTAKEQYKRIEDWLKDVNNIDRDIPSRDSQSETCEVYYEEILDLDTVS